MTKKKRISKGNVSLGDEEASTASSHTLASLQDLQSGDDTDADLLDPFERCLEALYEKRASARIAALSDLVSLMERSYSYEEVCFRQESLTRMLLGCLRRGGTSEASLAVRGLGLQLVTLGAGSDSERLVAEVSLALQKIATDSKRDASLRALALQVLSLLIFAAVEDEFESEKVMTGLLKLASTQGSPQISSSSLSGWALLLSCMPPIRINSAFCDLALTVLTPHLDATDVQLRNAAGEAIALLFSVAGLSSLQGNDAWAEEGTDAGSVASGLEEVMLRMKALATNRGDVVRRSKRDRSYLKSTFREHCKAVEGQEMTFDRVRLQDGSTLVIDTLEGQIQLNAFRHFLATGFQTHLEANPLLRDVFGLGEGFGGYEAQEDTKYRVSRAPPTKTQKSRSKGRTKQQTQKAYDSGAVLGALGSDDFGD